MAATTGKTMFLNLVHVSKNIESNGPVPTGAEILTSLKPEQFKHEEART